MPYKYSIISTCKGRLNNLKLTLPEFLKQENTEVIVVDYDCPDNTADYIAQHYPSVKVVAVKDKPKFNISDARNLGAAHAKGEFLIFLDADVLIAENFIQHIDQQITEHSFGEFNGPTTKNSLRGSCVVWRKDFERIGGYDALMIGYGGEDLDIYTRLNLLGAKNIHLNPTIVLDVIQQTVEEKERYRAPNLQIQFLRGQLYLLAKNMVMKIEGSVDLNIDVRKGLLERINRQLKSLYAGEKDFVLEVNWPDKMVRGLLKDWEFSTSIVVKAKRKKY